MLSCHGTWCWLCAVCGLVPCCAGGMMADVFIITALASRDLAPAPRPTLLLELPSPQQFASPILPLSSPAQPTPASSDLQCYTQLG